MSPLSLLISLSLLHAASSFSPSTNYLINCGSDIPKTIDSDNRIFLTDENSNFLHSTRTIRLTYQNPPPGSSLVHNSARVFDKPESYVFKTVEKGTYLIRLHFYGFNGNFGNYDLGNAQFHVSVNGFLFLYNFTIGSFSQSVKVFDYVVWVDKDEIFITFTPSEKGKFAFVNAIEVISAPKDLVADVATQVSDLSKVGGLTKYAMETVYRVNVGGDKITPFNDSLWRTWVTDDGYLKTSDGSKVVRFGGRIKYRDGGASREVGPDNMYNSARVIRISKDSVPRTNISWEFQVKEGYKYLVRLHFCDIASASLGMIYFNVFVNENLVVESMDLSEITNSLLASPYYADFVVDGTKSLSRLSVSVGPSNMSIVNGVDGILNGIEIMKMNNSMGSLDGEVSVGEVSMIWKRRGGDCVFVSLVAVLCLLVIASLMMNRRWDGIKDSVAWTPLPITEVNLKSGVGLSIRK